MTRHTHAAATRIVAAYEGWPGAAEDISAEDAVAAARGYLCLAARESDSWSPLRAATIAIAAGLALAGILFAFLISLPTPGAMS